MTKLKNIISYLHPILLEAREGTVTPYLEVVKQNGKNILNSRNANYSFNGLNLIFKQLFKKINLQNYSFKNILILGMGAGNAVELLRETYQIKSPITAIEKDSVVIELAKTHFNIERYKDLTIINGDAFEFVQNCHQKYDFIISDLFIDDIVPKIFASKEYIMGLKRITYENACVVYNKITEHPTHKQELTRVKEIFDVYFSNVEVHKFYVHEFENSVLYYNSMRTTPCNSNNNVLNGGHETSNNQT